MKALISAILIAIGGYLLTLQNPEWLPIIGGILTAVGGAVGKSGYDQIQLERKIEKENELQQDK